MEMESSRRSMDRTREPGMKKPRLGGDADFDRDRVFSQRASVGGAAPAVSRFRASERERDDSIRGAGHYQPQQQHEEQEIVAQYKTALAELTFNSKPIITNLTIIAGENTQAAKGIATTICANILEVPREQKLPSLYLLDSIVKNIPRDYARHFSGRLPEVFCKAYKQVDSSIHPSMRHLFGTWKGVFPQATLQMIEKELGFTPAVNGSSSGTATSRPDSQLQRQPHSIHVNPKYLEAHQRLQVRAKSANNEATGSAVTMTEGAERPDSSSVTGGSRPWVGVPVKATTTQRSQRDHSTEAAHNKNLDAVYGGDYDYGSDFSQHSDLGIGKGRERISVRETVDKPSLYSGGSNSANKLALGQRNGFDAPNSYRNSRDPRAQANNQHHTKFMANRSNKGTSGNWKNSEEEEFMWEDMNSRLIDEGGSESSRKDSWNTEEAEKTLTNVTRGKWMPLETELLDTSRWNSHDISRLEKSSGSEERVPLKTEIEDRFNQARGISNMSRSGVESYTDTLSGGQAAFGHQTPRLWPSQDTQVSDGLKHKCLASVVSGQPASSLLTSASRSSRASAHLQNPPRPPSPSEPSSFYQQPRSPPSAGSMDNDFSHPPSLSQSGQRSQLVGLKRDPRIQARQESLSVALQSQVRPVQNQKLPPLQPLQHLQSLTPLPTLGHHSHQLPVSQQPLVEPSNLALNSLSKPLVVGSQAVDMSTSGDSNQSAAELLKASSTSTLLAAIMKSGLVGSNLVTGGTASLIHPESSHVNIQPPLPCGPPPVPQTSSSMPSVDTTSHMPSLITHTSKKVQPPLLPGPHPSTSIEGSTSPTASSITAVPNPLSNLLSALVAKGLISTPATELVTQNESQLHSHENESQLHSHENESQLHSQENKSQLHSQKNESQLHSQKNESQIHSQKNESQLHSQKNESQLHSQKNESQLHSQKNESQLHSQKNESQLLSQKNESRLHSQKNESRLHSQKNESQLHSQKNESQLPTEPQKQSTGLGDSSSVPVSLTVTSSTDVKSRPDPAVTGTSSSNSPPAEVQYLIGTEFRSQVIREMHPKVISSLFDDLPHQCCICGLRLVVQEDLDRHLDWHASRKEELASATGVSRKWFETIDDWVSGKVGRSVGPSTRPIEEIASEGEMCEPMVPADESQCICALCGEPFEDWYNEERDEWMYRGTVYFPTLAGEGAVEKAEKVGIIVHANCISQSRAVELAAET